MRTQTLLILLFVILSSHKGLAHSNNQTAIALETLRVTDNIHMLRGPGGNIAVISDGKQTILVDGKYAHTSSAMLDAVKAISSAPISFVINTHYHSDHTGANTHLSAADATIIAHENTRRLLSAPRDENHPNPRLPELEEGLLPVLTVSHSLKIHLSDETIEIMHFPSGHTSGDLVVFFKNANVIHTGDLYFAGVTPFIDIDNGGSYAGYLSAMQAILARADEQSAIIPGHGPLASKAMMLQSFVELSEFDPTTLD